MTFKPSEVNLEQMFLATFDHLEAESTAAVIVKVLAMNGDTWRPATCAELHDGFVLLTKDEGPWRTWFNNPFRRIDTHDLVDRGFAVWGKGEWAGGDSLQFTEKGLQRMEKWVRKAV